MDFKISITCVKCDCTFQLRPQDFKERHAAECPNCGQQFPDKIYTELKNGILALDKVPEYITEDVDNPYADNLFNARIDGYGVLHSLFGNKEN